MVLFLGCSVVLCDFHREQAWDRWLSATSNGMRNVKEIALSLMRKIAASETNEEYNENILIPSGAQVKSLDNTLIRHGYLCTR